MKVRLAIGLLILVQVAGAPARACDVPVFRFAFDNWAVEPYRAVVFHRGPPAAHQLAAIAALEGMATTEIGTTRLTVRTVDLGADPDGSLRDLWESRGQQPLPWLVLQYPVASSIEDEAWSGPLTADTVEGLASSPCREEIARRIVAGESAVWVLLESGDKAKDEGAAGMLQAELARMSGTLELPGLPGEPAQELRYWVPGPPLRIAFSVVRVSRSDPAEECFVSMLLHSETDLLTFAEPMAFAVYGRGRLLYALVGEGINPHNIAGACALLTGPCLCVYKATTPGTQLLTTTEWTAYGAPAYPIEVAESATVQALAAPAVGGATRRNVLLVAAGGIVVALSATVAVGWKARRATA